MQSKSGSDLQVSEKIRNEIASYKAQMCDVGEIMTLSSEKSIVAVGDVTAQTLNDAGIPLLLEIVDLKTQRSEDGTFKHVEDSILVKNPPATLTLELFNAIERCIGRGEGNRIEVQGEEDLAVIPIIFYSDLNTVVVYGVPNRGMACINVNQEAKDYVNNLIKRMEEE